MITFATYNLFNFGRNDPGAVTDVAAREENLFEVIRDIDSDVLAVQELIGATPDAAADQLLRLADATGMECLLHQPVGKAAPKVAVASATSGFSTGVLWRTGITPIAWRAIGPGDLWHALATIVLDIGGAQPVKVGSYHADPFRPDRRFTDALRVISMFRQDQPEDQLGTLHGRRKASTVAEPRPVKILEFGRSSARLPGG
ncbi:hypothetical protein [Dactylosporangium sp. NPDC051484]|uniref:endonuclease/exonuclease/phosphatase family protein n=1 Tax=Dactylosporangium sp. NPDC051484 TaxID=3154942 RepID=UPI00344DC629